MKESKKILVLVLMFFSYTGVWSQNDSLFIETGEVFVGEIKSMSKSILTFDTYYADSDFKIEWNNVVGLNANSFLIVHTVDGSSYTGKLLYSQESPRLLTLAGADHVELSVDDIVEIYPSDKSFWKRFGFSVDVGYSYAKANHVNQLTTNSKVDYRGYKWTMNGYLNTMMSNQDSVAATRRNDAGVNYSLDLVGNVFAFAGIEFLNNSEQQLDLRTTSKLGVGYFFIRTNALYLVGGAGLANANEDYGGENPQTYNSFEGLAVIEFEAFDIGDFSLHTRVSLFPSLNSTGRIRLDRDVSLKWDLPLDFYIKASYQHNFDSQPPQPNVSKTDFVLQASFGWEWE